MCTSDKALLKLMELAYNTRMHNSNLSHQMFFLLTGLTIGSSAISAQLSGVALWEKLALSIFSVFVPIAGLFMTYRLQNANDNHAIQLNRIYQRLGLKEMTFTANDGQKYAILPGSWSQYWPVRIKDFHLIPRCGVKAGRETEKGRDPSTSRISLWAVYKWIYFAMCLVSLARTVGLVWPLIVPYLVVQRAFTH